MSTKTITKNSTVPGNTPVNSDLSQGELAVNIPDSKLWVGDAAGGIKVVSEPPITKTITVGVEYATFHEAMVYFESLPPGSDITIMLPNGTHLIENVTASGGWEFAYTIQTKTLHLFAINAAATPTVTITLKADNPAGQQMAYFAVYYGGAIAIKGIKFDVTGNGYVAHSDVHCVQAAYNSTILYSYWTKMNEFNTAVTLDLHSYAEFWSLHADECQYAINVRSGSSADIWGEFTATNTTNTAATIFNADYLKLTGTNTLTGNIQDYSVPLNEVQDDGSYIADGTGLNYIGGTF